MLNRKLLLPLLILFLLLAACGAAATEEPFLQGIAPPMEAPLVEEEMFRASDSTGMDFGDISDEDMAAGGNQADDGQQRIVLKNAELSVVVEDPSASMDAIAALAEGMGGFVVSSNLYQTHLASGLEVPQANITVRVPAESLLDVLAEIEGGADRTVSKNISGIDVTRDYTDQQSRLRNLQNAEAQLTEIMDAAIGTDEVLDVFNRLTQISAEIEIVKGQIQYYEQAARLSAVSVTLIANEADQPISIGGWEPAGVAKDAIEALIKILQTLVNILIWLVLVFLPVLLVITLPIWLLVRILRGWRRRRKAAIEPTPES